MAHNDDRILTLNCGLGRDSITMICLLIEGRLEVEGLGIVTTDDIDVVVFSDTGCEWRHSYDVKDAVAELCAAHNLRFLTLEKGDDEEAKAMTPSSWAEIEEKAARGGYHIRPALMADFESRATVASLGKGDCTDNHKIQPIRRLINDISLVRFGINNRSYGPRVKKGKRQPHISLIGIAADETSRLENGGRGPLYTTEAYPLVTMGIAKPDEAPILEAHGFNHVRKSGCFCCPYQPASWYWALSVTEPETWARVVAYEAHALERNERMNVTGLKSGKALLRLPEVVARWRAANPDATVDAVLDKQYTRCTKEAREVARRESKELANVPAPAECSCYVPPSPSSFGFEQPSFDFGC